MRVWVDMTNSPHVPFFRPLLALLEQRGHEVRVSARDFAQTLELLDAAGHRPRRRRPAARRCRARSARSARWARVCGRCARWARPLRFDLALSHASHELPLAARIAPGAVGLRVRLRVRARAAHAGLTCGDAGRRPGRDPAGAPRPARRDCRQGAPVRRAQGGVLPRRLRAGRLGARRRSGSTRHACWPSCGRRPRCRCTTVTEVRCSGTCSSGSARDPGVQAVVLPRTPTQRDALLRAALPSLVVPEHAIDAQSLIALADLVVSAGGTMNREAVALGTPVWTTFAGTARERRRAPDRGRAARRARRPPTRSWSQKRDAAPARGRRDPDAHARPAALGARR